MSTIEERRKLRAIAKQQRRKEREEKAAKENRGGSTRAAIFRKVQASKAANDETLWSRWQETNRCIGFHHYAILCISFSIDGKRFATGDYGGAIVVWEAPGQSVLFQLEGHWAAVNDIVWTNSADAIISASSDCSVIVWDAHTYEPRHICLGHSEPVTSVSVDLQSTLIVSGGEDGAVMAWDCKYAMWHPSEGSADALLFRIDPPEESNGKRTRSKRKPKAVTTAGHVGPVRAVALDRKAQYFCSCGDDQTIKIWDTDGSLLANLAAHKDAVYAIELDPTQKLLAAASRDKSISIWRLGMAGTSPSDTSFMHCLTGEHTSSIYDLSWGPNGQHLLSCCHDRSVVVWDALAAVALQKIATQHSMYVMAVALNPTDTQFITVSADLELRVWKPTTMKQFVQNSGLNKKAMAAMLKRARNRMGEAAVSASSAAKEITVIGRAKAKLALDKVKSNSSACVVC